MTLRIPPPPSSDKGENTADRFLSVQFRILKTNLTLEEKVAYALILSWQDRTCFYSNANFAELLSCSKRKAQDVLGSLAKKGLVEVIPREGTSNIYRAIPWQGVLPLTDSTLAESATPPSRICYPPTQTVLPPLAESATNKNNYKINDKIIDKSAVADAPSPSLSEPHRFVVSELTSEQRATLLALLDGPARLGGHDPAKVLDSLLADCQRYSNGGNDKKRFRVCWFETLKRQFVGKKIKDWAARPARPLGASGLTYQQQQTCFRDFWNEAHGLDRPDLSWVNKQQGVFLQKLMGRFGGSEDAYVEILAKKRPDQFDYQFSYFANAIKELEKELAK